MKIKVTPIQKERLTHWANKLAEYPKTVETLKDGTGYCCLGVACELSGLEDWDENSRNQYTYSGEKGYLPERVKAWYGFHSYLGWNIPNEIIEEFFNIQLDRSHQHTSYMNLVYINDELEFNTHEEMSKFLNYLLENHVEIVEDTTNHV